jgi:hypothetical protein
LARYVLGSGASASWRLFWLFSPRAVWLRFFSPPAVSPLFWLRLFFSRLSWPVFLPLSWPVFWLRLFFSPLSWPVFSQSPS